MSSGPFPVLEIQPGDEGQGNCLSQAGAPPFPALSSGP